MGVSGVAPSLEEVAAWSRREAEWASRGGTVFAPSTNGAVPESGPASTEGLRTIPPRENGGNMDVKQLTAGSRLFLPVSVEGALFSTGDGHFAQGDGEVCLTAAEMGATVVVRFVLHKGEADKVRGGSLRFSHAGEFARPEQARLGNFIATMGMPINAEGVNEGENLNLATRNALQAMIELLGERGYNRSQAYAICSVAVDLKISQVVDVPNFIVSAFLAEEMFETA
jgi:formamidase